ncbi:MAG: hypothetical protein K8R58_11235 [Bacteroidales bacterium]|nr:hypothetical protein [Bacteroidales bacterium]
MNVLNKIHISKARITNWIMLFIIIYTTFNLHYWTSSNRVICWDIVSYYAYLPSAFIHNDIKLDFTDKDPQKYLNKFWPEKTASGEKVIKTSMGLAMLYSPFFFIGHLYAKIYNYPTDGFSLPYKLFLTLSSIFYLSIGLYFLRKILEKYFNQTIVIFTLVSIVCGTNLFYYTSIESPLPHAYNFSLFAVFLFLTIKWHEKPCIKNSFLIGIILGLISLIRPTNTIIIIIFVFWGIASKKDFVNIFRLFFKKYYLILIMITGFFIIWSPQFLYWKAVTGQWLYYSYGDDEKFFFTNPQIINGLFSYRKGWLLYTPIMFFALLGILLSLKKFKQFFLPFLIFTLINIYLILSWWCWWYGGGYGLRAFIDSYSLLAVPFAVFLSWSMKQRKFIRITTKTLVILLILFSIFQTKQYYGGYTIHHDSMTKKAYWAVFFRLNPPDAYKKLLKSPDYEKARKGIREY